MFISEHVRVLTLSIELLLIIWIDVRLSHLFSLGVFIRLLLSCYPWVSVRWILLGYYPRICVRSLKIWNTCRAGLMVLVLAWSIWGLYTRTLFWFLLENIWLPILQLIGKLMKLLRLAYNLWLEICLSIRNHFLMVLVESISSIWLSVSKCFLHVIVLPTWNHFLLLVVLLSVWDHIRLVIILLLV